MPREKRRHRYLGDLGVHRRVRVMRKSLLPGLSTSRIHEVDLVVDQIVQRVLEAARHQLPVQNNR